MLMRRYRYHEVEPHEDMMPIERPTALQELMNVFKTSFKFTRKDLIEFMNIFDEFYDEVFEGVPVLKTV